MTDMSTHPVAAEALPPKVAAAICGVMAEVPMLGKGEKNQHGNYNFASIDDFLEAVRPLCAKHGLIIMQDEEAYEMKDGWLIMTFRFTLAHSSGETWGHRPTRTIMVSSKMGSQAFGAAQSYALKQFERSLFQIATGEKGNDADEHPPADLPGGPKKAQPRTVPATPSAAQKTAPESTDKGAEGPSPAAVKFTDGLIKSINEADSYADASRILMDHGLTDVDDTGWLLEADTKLAKLKNTAPTEYARLQAAYEARKVL